MATSIVNPSGGGFNFGGAQGLDQIAQAFGPIHGMMGPTTLSGGGSGGFGMSPQPVSGADNSVTAGQRASMNMLGQMAPTAFQTGQGLLGTGTNVAQGGLGVMGTGLNTMQPSIDFYNKLASGDPATMTSALAPTAANLSTMYSALRNQTAESDPYGGNRATTLANLPYAQMGQLSGAAYQLQPQAIQALAQLGGEQAQIGQGMAGVGTQLGQLGTTLTGQGLSGTEALANALLTKQRINQMDPTVMQQIQQALGIAGTLAGGIGGAMAGGPQGYAGATGVFSGLGQMAG